MQVRIQRDEAINMANKLRAELADLTVERDALARSAVLYRSEAERLRDTCDARSDRIAVVELSLAQVDATNDQLRSALREALDFAGSRIGLPGADRIAKLRKLVEP